MRLTMNYAHNQGHIVICFMFCYCIVYLELNYKGKPIYYYRKSYMTIGLHASKRSCLILIIDYYIT